MHYNVTYIAMSMHLKKQNVIGHVTVERTSLYCEIGKVKWYWLYVENFQLLNQLVNRKIFKQSK